MTGRFLFPPYALRVLSAVVLLLLCVSLPDSHITHAQQSGLEPVTLQLKWRHQFQFAGYYAAQMQGLYRDAGLDVRIVEATKGVDPIQAVVDGEADFGVGTTELVLWRSRGIPVVVLGAVFQHSPLTLVAPSSAGITSLHALENQRIGIEPNSAELLAYLQEEGVDLDALEIETRDFSIDRMLHGDYAAISAYSTDEPFVLQQLGVDYLSFSPRSAGIDFYGDVLFTTQRQIDEHPERVQAFLQASMAGWQYAFQQPDALINYIYTNLSQRHSREHLAFEAGRMRQFVLPDMIEIGAMSVSRWNTIIRTYARVGLIPRLFQASSMLYQPNPPPNLTPLYTGIVVALVTLGIVAVVALRFYRLYAQLQKETAQRSTAQALLESSEARYRTLVESAPFPVVISSLLDHNVRYMNPRAEAIFHVAPESRIGKPAVDGYTHPEERARLIAQVEQHQHVDAFDTMLMNAHGNQFWASISAAKVLYEDEPCVFVTFTDLSERRQMEARLRESEALYRSILHGSPDAIALTDIEWRYTMVSPSWLRMFGYASEDEAIGQSLVEVLGPATYDVAMDDLRYIVEYNEGGVGIYETKRRDGHLFTVEAATEVIGENASPDRKLLFIVRDITDRKLAEQRNLELAVEQTRVKLLASFIQNASHEFRTPLSIINSSTYLMSRMDDVERRQAQADKIMLQVQLISRLVEMLTQIATLDSGASLKRVPVDVEILLREVLNRLQNTAKKAEVTLKLETITAPPVVYLDADRIHTALHHLLDNAVRFSRAGDVVSLCADSDPTTLRIEVRDTGIGIADEVQPHIFDHFWRQDTAHTTPGLGLGLTLAQKIAVAHGGSIQVESRLGQGSVFQLVLPLESHAPTDERGLQP
jgi:PAS domain S-box-containing protein